jgi:tRNA(Ile)-lysidine synthase
VVPFNAAALHQALKRYPTPHRYWVAFSGGLDSTVLVHAMADLRSGLRDAGIALVHVDHGLSPASAAWSHHCEAIGAELGLRSRTLRVEARNLPSESPEAAARQARYQALASLLQPQECLLTAHHQDDQAETVLLQLLRGSGVAGLAAMPSCMPFGNGWLARPLLGFTRAQLKDYADQRGLRWLEDESNFDVSLDRNYLRRRVVPRLRERWPGYARTLSRAASHAAEAAQLLGELARVDIDRVGGSSPDTLSVSRLHELEAHRQRNAIRFWLRRLGLPMPPAARLQSILDTALNAAPDRNPRIDWPGAEVRRYRDLLYAMPPIPEQDPSQILAWNLRSPLALRYCRLLAKPATGQGLSALECERWPVTVRFRQGGERCRPAGSSHTRPLKTLFQERGIPPWLRDRIPLVYLGEALAAVADLWICQPFEAGCGKPGWVLQWERGRSYNG